MTNTRLSNEKRLTVLQDLAEATAQLAKGNDRIACRRATTAYHRLLAWLTEVDERGALIDECNRLCGELGGPDDCTFEATSTEHLRIIRDELRAMKAGKPLDGDDPLRNPLRNPLDNLKLTPA